MKVTVEDGTFASFVARPAVARASGGSVVVLHESSGLNDDIRSKCEAVAACGFLAIAPNLFWREELGIDTLAKPERENRSGTDHSVAFDHDRGVNDIAAVVRAVRETTNASARIGVMGFGLGGLLAYLAAARLPIDAAVVFYGPRIERHLAEVIRISIPLMMHVGSEDALVTPAALVAIEHALSHNANAQILRYPASGHAFARQAGAHYNAEAADLALNRTTAFLKLHLA
ncbi:dienelactone hydrolase family protein [Novosphingobium sp.]|uniref:dienelactone hydrolase family protein n=1 Tax=Novosphingobium sp. TaxID=1874826 RepID=UPI003BAAA9F8